MVSRRVLVYAILKSVLVYENELELYLISELTTAIVTCERAAQN